MARKHHMGMRHKAQGPESSHNREYMYDAHYDIARDGARGALRMGAAMIHENTSKFCNLPDEVMNKEWPRDHEVMGRPIPYDKFNATKAQKSKDIAKFRENFSAGKY
jgi:hypothetical protein